MARRHRTRKSPLPEQIIHAQTETIKKGVWSQLPQPVQTQTWSRQCWHLSGTKRCMDSPDRACHIQYLQPPPRFQPRGLSKQIISKDTQATVLFQVTWMFRGNTSFTWCALIFSWWTCDVVTDVHEICAVGTHLGDLKEINKSSDEMNEGIKKWYRLNICFYLHTETSAWGAGSNLMLIRVRTGNILQPEAIVVIHVILTGPEEAQVLQNDVTALSCVTKGAPNSKYFVWHSIAQIIHDTASSQLQVLWRVVFFLNQQAIQHAALSQTATNYTGGTVKVIRRVIDVLKSASWQGLFVFIFSVFAKREQEVAIFISARL